MSRTPEPAPEPTSPEPRVFLRVVRGEPTDDELAALTVVIAVAVAGASDDAPPAPRTLWGDPAVALRESVSPGPGAWRAAYLPR